MKSKDHFKINDFKTIQFIFLSIMLTIILRQSYLQQKNINKVNIKQLDKEIKTNVELTKKHMLIEKDVIDRFENLKFEKIKSMILNNSDKNKINKQIYRKNTKMLPLNLSLVFVSLLLIYLFFNQLLRRKTNPTIENFYNNPGFLIIYSIIFGLYIVSFFVYHKFFVE